MSYVLITVASICFLLSFVSIVLISKEKDYRKMKKKGWNIIYIMLASYLVSVSNYLNTLLNGESFVNVIYALSFLSLTTSLVSLFFYNLKGLKWQHEKDLETLNGKK